MHNLPATHASLRILCFFSVCWSMDYEPRHDVVFLNARPSSPRTLFLIHDPHIFGGTDTITTSTQSTNPIIAIHHHCHCHCLVIHRCVSLCTYVLGPHAPSHITQSQMLRWLFLWLDLRPVFSCWHSSMSFWWYSDWSSTDCLYSCTCLLAPPLNLTDLFRSSFLTSFFIIRKQTFCVWLCVCLVALCVFVCTATHTLRSIRSGSFGEWGGDHHVSRN